MLKKRDSHPSRLARWTAPLPLKTIDASIRQMREARENGAVGVLFRGVEGNRTLDDPYFFPLYEEAATHCHSVKDYVTRDIFESLMKDEESHIDFLETQIDLVKKIGVELYSQKHIGEMDHD